MDKLDLILNEIKGMPSEFKEIKSELKDLKQNVLDIEKKLNIEFAELNNKLEIIKKQTAYNTEYYYHIKQIETRIDDLETDVKMIKKLISNNGSTPNIVLDKN
ncbi:hypothetical protein BSNK01_02750 [Bacillaceae bacterium]